MSKIAQIKDVIFGMHCMDDDPLTTYHAARAARNACYCRDPYRKLFAVKKALKNHRVIVTLGPIGDVLIRNMENGKSVVL